MKAIQITVDDALDAAQMRHVCRALAVATGC